MAIITINQGYYPSGLTLTVQAGGTLAVSTEFFYRVAAVNALGQTVANDAVSASTTDVNRTIKVDWNKVAGATSYRIFRNTSDAWTSGNLLVGTVNAPTVTLTDNGLTGQAGTPLAFSTSGVLSCLADEPNVVPRSVIPGKLKGITQHQGSAPPTLRIEFVEIGTNASTQLTKIQYMASHHVPVQIQYYVFGATWISDYYYIDSLTWNHHPGTVDASGGEYLYYAITCSYVAD